MIANYTPNIVSQIPLCIMLCLQGETQEGFIRQLLPKAGLPHRVNVQIFGHSGVGKSTLVDTLKTGYFSSFFRRSRPLVSNNTNCKWKLTILGDNPNNIVLLKKYFHKPYFKHIECAWMCVLLILDKQSNWPKSN